jgi:hypothetical protein
MTSSIEDQEKLISILKFTPRTYRVSIWGYGGEYVMGTVSREIYDYFRHRRLDLNEYAWDSDYAETHNIPEDMQPFMAGSWHECDDLGHTHGCDMDSGTLQIEDENFNTVFERGLEDCDGGDDSPGLSCGEETWIEMAADGTVVFLGSSNDKGTFFEGEIALSQPFEIEKLLINYEDFDGQEVVASLQYDGEDIDNNGGSTNGKGSQMGFFVAGSLKSGKWEKYSNMDDLEYEMTEWFPKKIKPVRKGIYMVKTAGKNSYTYQAMWTGTRWVSSWTDQEHYHTAEEVKVREWQGIAYDPDTDWAGIGPAPVPEQDLLDDLEELKLEYQALVAKSN